MQLTEVQRDALVELLNIGFGRAGASLSKLTNQRDVVRNERRQGEGTPYGIVDEEVFHGWHRFDPRDGTAGG